MSGERVTLHRHAPGPDDAHGNATSTFTDEPVDGVAVSPREGNEPGNNRDAVVVGLTVYLPPGTVFGALDEMTVRGDRYKVVGKPGTWTNPYTGITRGVQAALEEVEG